MISWPPDDWLDLEPEEQEEHLTNECGLSIIEPFNFEYNHDFLTEKERELLKQFPKDDPEIPEYDEVLTLELIGARGQEVPERTAGVLLHGMAGDAEPVGRVFKTARFWCLRVKHV